MRPVASFDLTLPTPEENLACDEALLEEAEARGSAGVLRFWASPLPFVTLGYANRAAEEADLDACRAHRVPVLRRCSGGGTVLQGPGCLNYALILPIDDAGPLTTITGSNRFIMERHCAALAALLHDQVEVEGHTDLALGGRKFSGNAQRRKRTHLLFHGSFLLAGFNLERIERLLRPPPRPPEYRRGRTHLEFLTRLTVTREALAGALTNAWNAAPVPAEVPRATIDRLVAGKYSRAEWNLSR